MLLLYLGLGGAVGTVARYALGSWIGGRMGVGFPWGTLAVNVLGCFAFGVILKAAEAQAISPDTRTILTAGFCGAFTTFSALSYETIALLNAGNLTAAVAYTAGSFALGLAALLAGFYVVGL